MHFGGNHDQATDFIEKFADVIIAEGLSLEKNCSQFRHLVP